MRLRRGFAPNPIGEVYSAPPEPLAGFQGTASRQGRGTEKGREGRKGEKRRGEFPHFFFLTI